MAQPFLGNESTFKKRETEMTKRMVCNPFLLMDFMKHFIGFLLQFFSSLVSWLADNMGS